MAEWNQALSAHVAQARQVLRKFMEGPIEVEPLPDGRGVRVSGQAALGRVLRCGVPNRIGNGCTLKIPGFVDLGARASTVWPTFDCPTQPSAR
jgi:hypothetical protein